MGADGLITHIRVSDKERQTTEIGSELEARKLLPK